MAAKRRREATRQESGTGDPGEPEARPARCGALVLALELAAVAWACGVFAHYYRSRGYVELLRQLFGG